MAVERRLAENIGPVAGRLHTARSRNDQVATDGRLYAMEACAGAIGGLIALQSALLDLAEANFSAVMPGYTHLQRAQPVLFAHHLLAYVEMFDRDTRRFAFAHTTMDVLPLGSGALAGVPYDIDWPKTSSSGRAPSSDSYACRTRLRPVRASCPRRRTLTSPSWPAAAAGERSAHWWRF
jgi:argininosuccinate lyase